MRTLQHGELSTVRKGFNLSELADGKQWRMHVFLIVMRTNILCTNAKFSFLSF